MQNNKENNHNNENKMPSNQLDNILFDVSDDPDEKMLTKNSIDKKRFSNFKNITKEMALLVLEKSPGLRIDIENRLIADYLSKNFEYFNKIKEYSMKRFLKLISVISIEIYKPGELIINVGFEEDKFFIIFEGNVEIYRQKIYEQEMKLVDFCHFIVAVKNKNEKKYERILYNNRHLTIDYEDIIDNPFFEKIRKRKFKFYTEELEEVGKFNNGYVFGEMNLIRKEEKNIIAKAISQTTLISVSKFDFNRILRTIEEKRLEQQAEIFKKNFTMFKYWSMEQLVTLFNYCTYVDITKDEFVIKQNEPSHYIYFIEEGKFEQYCNVSFSWTKQFIESIGEYET